MNQFKNLSKTKKRIIFILITIITLTGSLLLANDLYLNGFEYRAKVALCNTDEPIVGNEIPKDPTPRYLRPTDPNYDVPWPQSHYFCTEQEAKDAGYLPKYNEDGSVNEEYLPSKYE